MSKDHQKKCEECGAKNETLTKYKGEKLCRSCLCGDYREQPSQTTVRSNFGRTVDLRGSAEYILYTAAVPLSFGLPRYIGE